LCADYIVNHVVFVQQRTAASQRRYFLAYAAEGST